MELRYVPATAAVWIGEPPYSEVIGLCELAELLDVHPCTIRRWCRAGTLPRTAELAIAAAVLGEILAHKRWREWRVGRRDGRLYPPAGPAHKAGIAPGLLEAWEIVWAENRALWARLEALTNGAERPVTAAAR